MFDENINTAKLDNVRTCCIILQSNWQYRNWLILSSFTYQDIKNKLNVVELEFAQDEQQLKALYKALGTKVDNYINSIIQNIIFNVLDRSGKELGERLYKATKLSSELQDELDAEKMRSEKLEMRIKELEVKLKNQ